MITNLKKNWSKTKVDKRFLSLIIIITTIGFLIFLSAALGIQARSDGSLFKIVLNQALFGIIGGSIAAYICYKLPLSKLQEYALPLFIASIVLTLAVFIPGLGFSHGGATRWINLGPLTLQPAETLKIGAIIMASAWFAFLKQKSNDLKLGLGGTILIIAICSGVLLLQPDTGTMIVIIASVGAIYFVAGAKWRHIMGLLLIGIIALTLLIVTSEYRRERIVTFLNPAADSQGSGYQTQQSMIAVGSGQIIGRGPGQSIQKFNYLPEPIGDSIFAVYAEEYGFVGSVMLILLYSAIGASGFSIASKLKPGFEKLLVTGLITMITVQSILNIGAMVGVFPLSGMPLIFVSHGGTALLFSLAAVGLILQASTNIKTSRRVISKV